MSMQSNSPSSPIVAVERQITINAGSEAVFAYVADLRNDSEWRAEINRTSLDAALPAPGVLATEDAFLSTKRPNSITRLAYEAYEPSRFMRCLTTVDNTSWMSVERTFRPIGPTTTEFIYNLQFEQKVVREALGFAPPLWFLRWYSGWMMMKYLRKLKSILEARQAVVTSTH